MYRLEAVSVSRVLRMLPYIKHRNANGAHIYIRPTGESPYTLLDDLTPASLTQLTAEGYAPAAAIETSPGSFQAWLRHAQPLSKELGSLAAKTLADKFGADRNAADWRRFGRAPGFTNRKPQHRNAQGLSHSRASMHTKVIHSPPHPTSTLSYSSSSSRPNRNVWPFASAIRRIHHTSSDPFPCRDSAHPPATKTDQQPQIWRSV